MQKIKPLLLITSIVYLALTAASALAHEDQHRRIISTNGFGEIRVKPNMATLNLSVRAIHKSGKAAKQDVDDRINNFLDILKKLGIKKSDITASNLRVSPRYEHHSGNRQFKGYEANRTMSVTVRNLSELTDIMDKALEHRLEGIDQIRYDHSKADKYRGQAHQLAIKNSQIKAEALAKAYHAELGPVITVNYHNKNPIYGGTKREMTGDFAMVAMSRSQPGTYIADELVFNDNIQATFDLIINE